MTPICSARRCGPRAGFTLLEMLVALTLMAMLAGALYGSLHAGLRARSSAEAAIGPVRSAALALDFVSRDLSAAVPPTGLLAGPFIGEDDADLWSGKDADALTWHAATGKPKVGGTDIVRLTLLVVPDASGEAGALMRGETRNLLAPTEPEPEFEVLCRRVRALNLRYFDGDDWFDEWDSTTRDNTLPLRVEVTLEIEHEAHEGETFRMTRVVALPCARRGRGRE